MFVGTEVAFPGRGAAMSILIDGEPQPLYRRDDGEIFVAGEEGGGFSVQITNRSRAAIEVVLAVDQQDVLRGQPATLGTLRGLSLTSGGVLVVEGWKHLENTTPFTFGVTQQTLGTQFRDGIARFGVIGAAAFIQPTPDFDPDSPSGEEDMLERRASQPSILVLRYMPRKWLSLLKIHTTGYPSPFVVEGPEYNGRYRDEGWW